MNPGMLWKLFTCFARVGGMTFGGGYAILPILQREVVENRGWATEEELTDYFAIGQCTPGIIAVNTATFVGQKQAGPLGGIAATLGVVFPSMVIITVIAAVLSNFAENEYVRHAFGGVRVCVTVLICNAVIKLWKKTVVDKATLVIFLAVLALGVLPQLVPAFPGISPVFYVVGAGVAGAVIQGLRGGRK